MTSNNSYFAIGNYKQIFGVANLSPGDVLIWDICKIKIEKVNKSGKATKISAILNDKLLNTNTAFLYINENSLTYNQLDVSSMIKEFSKKMNY